MAEVLPAIFFPVVVSTSSKAPGAAKQSAMGE
jgi:hypothetical protein